MHDETKIVGKVPTDTDPVEAVLSDGESKVGPTTADRHPAHPPASQRDPATLALANGARRYFQPSGSLGREETLYVLATVCGVIGNFDDIVRLGQAINLPSPVCTEEAPDAAERSATVLAELHRRGLAGKEFAVATLGKRGSIVADWKRGRAYRIAIEITDGSNGVPTPPGTGDLFLGHYLLYRELWASADHLRDPEAAVAMRASHAVAKWLGLRRDQYDVRVIQLDIL